MGYEVSVEVDVHCDKCSHTAWLEYSEPMSEGAIDSILEAEGWEWRGNDLLCPDCASTPDSEQVFLDRCRECTRRVGIHCPHYKRTCHDVFHRVLHEDTECPYYLPIGGAKEGPPQYKPTTASLEGFVEGLGKEDP